MLSDQSKPPAAPLAAFERSAAIYDAITAAGGKDYSAEAAIIAEHLEPAKYISIGANPPRLIEWGCGTGEFLRRWAAFGWHATGIDPSAEMLAIAAGKELAVGNDLGVWLGVELELGDMRYASGARAMAPLARASVCLFHAFSYACITPMDLKRALENVRCQMPVGGRFVFDVLNIVAAVGFLRRQEYRRLDMPGHPSQTLVVDRTKRFDPVSSVVEVVMDYSIEEGEAEQERWQEVHRMRAFSPAELLYALDDCEFAVLKMFDMHATWQGQEKQEIGCDTWAFTIVAEAR